MGVFQDADQYTFDALLMVECVCVCEFTVIKEGHSVRLSNIFKQQQRSRFWLRNVPQHHIFIVVRYNYIDKILLAVEKWTLASNAAQFTGGGGKNTHTHLFTMQREKIYSGARPGSREHV